jgi:serine/threonine-protein kinase
MKKCYTISIPVRTFWLRFLPLCLLFGAVGALVGFIAVDRYVMPRIVGVQRDMISTPDVQGMPYDDARNKFFAVGLLTEERGREFNEEIPDGSVISQFPAPGEMVKKGRKIAVTVSRGGEAAEIPQVRRMTEQQARLDLRRSGFKVGAVKRAWHETVPLDGVVETNPPGGTTTSRAIDVEIVVSRGPKPTHADVPNIIGDPLSEARKKVEEAGLRVGRVTTQNSSAVPPGSVISQSAPPGSKIPLEASVDIVVSATR